MTSDFRETGLRISGESLTVRTEKGGKIRNDAQLEAAHMKAVKEAITKARQKELLKGELEGAVPGTEYYEKRMKACAPKPVRFSDHKRTRRPFPKVSYTFPEIPENVREFHEEIEPQEIVIRREEKVMARMVIEKVTCDACSKKDVEREATTDMTIMDDHYDLCDEHGTKFRGWFAEALGTTGSTAKSA